jgi:methyl-accepting chemotaxis protein
MACERFHFFFTGAPMSMPSAPTLACSSINTEQLLAFAHAMRSGNFAARLPALEGDDPAAEATLQFNCFAQQMQATIAEINRLSNELAHGEFGGQCEMVVNIRRGPWRECVEAFNAMEWALTEQVRDVAKTAARLAAGRADRPLTAPCEGEMLKLKESMNAVVERMNKG